MSGKVLITGGGGMLAQALRRALPASMGECVSLDRKTLDISDPRQIEKAMTEHRPTLVFNCAAYTKVDLAEKEREQANACNGSAVGVLGGLCKTHGATLVHFSTDYVFDGSLRRPLRPDDPVGPASAYGQSKLLGEHLLRENAPARWMILRTAWLYGAGGPNFVQTMVNVARAGKPLKVIDDQIGCPTYTVDLAQAAIDLVSRGGQGILHVSNAGQTSWFDFAAAIFQEWRLEPELSATTSAAWKASKPDSAVRPAYSVLDVAPTEKLLGRPMRDWRAALKAFKAEVDARGAF
jgi:dTDP-4-dehydrorhamnose reductase